MSPRDVESLTPWNVQAHVHYNTLGFVLLDSLARACQMRVLIWVLAICSPKLYVFLSCLTKSLRHSAFKNKSLPSSPKPDVSAPENKLGRLYF